MLQTLRHSADGGLPSLHANDYNVYNSHWLPPRYDPRPDTAGSAASSWDDPSLVSPLHSSFSSAEEDSPAFAFHPPSFPPPLPNPTSHPADSPDPDDAAKTYNFVSLPGNAVKKRPRRRYDEIERLYHCAWPGCTKSYGTLNHLNAHIVMQRHGQKRSPGEFKELRKQWRKAKKDESDRATRLALQQQQQRQQQQQQHHHHQQQQYAHTHTLSHPVSLPNLSHPSSYQHPSMNPAYLPSHHLPSPASPSASQFYNRPNSLSVVIPNAAHGQDPRYHSAHPAGGFTYDGRRHSVAALPHNSHPNALSHSLSVGAINQLNLPLQPQPPHQQQQHHQQQYAPQNQAHTLTHSLSSNSLSSSHLSLSPPSHHPDAYSHPHSQQQQDYAHQSSDAWHSRAQAQGWADYPASSPQYHYGPTAGGSPFGEDRRYVEEQHQQAQGLGYAPETEARGTLPPDSTLLTPLPGYIPPVQEEQEA